MTKQAMKTDESTKLHPSKYSTPITPVHAIRELGEGPALLLNTLHYWAKRDGGHVWKGSQRQLEKMTGVSRRSVIRRVEKLEELGLIEVERTFGSWSVYSIQADAVQFIHKPKKQDCEICQSSDTLSQVGASETGDTSSHPPVTDRHRTGDTSAQDLRRIVTPSNSSSREDLETSPSARPLGTEGSDLRSSGRKKKGRPADGKTLSKQDSDGNVWEIDPQNLMTWPVCTDCGDIIWDGLPDPDDLREWEQLDLAQLQPYCTWCGVRHEKQTKAEERTILRTQGDPPRCEAPKCNYFEETPGAKYCRKHLRQLATSA